ncbi:MAG: acyl-homoserine-lactone synthase [Thermodesulfobacteriota bacterium]|nr:MAG: acyl-homoserine-lactone synthase [Thermodesulfobacteriota bacterium]
MELIFEEDEFIIKTISAPEEFEAALKLRHEVFAEELKWVPEATDGLERDPYDAFSYSIGVFREDMTLAGSLRMILPPNPFMIDREFAALLPNGKTIERSPDVAEITRLCVRKEFRSNKGGHNMTLLLYKGLYHWNIMNGVRYSAMVVDNRCYRILRLGCLPVEAVGDFKTMPDGVKAAVCMLDWRRFEKEASARRPDYYEWMSVISMPANRYRAQSLSHAPCLPH